MMIKKPAEAGSWVLKVRISYDSSQQLIALFHGRDFIIAKFIIAKFKNGIKSYTGASKSSASQMMKRVCSRQLEYCA